MPGSPADRALAQDSQTHLWLSTALVALVRSLTFFCLAFPALPFCLFYLGLETATLFPSMALTRVSVKPLADCSVQRSRTEATCTISHHTKPPLILSVLLKTVGLTHLSVRPKQNKNNPPPHCPAQMETLPWILVGNSLPLKKL